MEEKIKHILSLFSDVEEIASKNFPMPTEGLLPISVTPEYKKLTEILDYCIEMKEISPRVYNLSHMLMKLNPVNYVAYGACQTCLFNEIAKLSDKTISKDDSLKLLNKIIKSLTDELSLMEEPGRKFLKNYQLWSHRYECFDKIIKAVETYFSRFSLDEEQKTNNINIIKSLVQNELHYIYICFTDGNGDPKNYHCWDYRIKVVTRYINFLNNHLKNEIKAKEVKEFLYEKEHKEFCNTLLTKDTRNNSVWNYRMTTLAMLLTNKFSECPLNILTLEERDDIITSEIELNRYYITRSPMNESSWNFLFGLTNFALLILPDKTISPASKTKVFNEAYELIIKYAKTDNDSVISPYAAYARYELYQLRINEKSKIYINQEPFDNKNEKQCIIKLLKTLKEFDNTRTNWWEWLINDFTNNK